MSLPDSWPFISGSTNFTMALDYDASGNNIYVGWAQPGAAQGSSVWRIMQQTFNGSDKLTDIKWPSGSTGFGFIWTSRASYAYS